MRIQHKGQQQECQKKSSLKILQTTKKFHKKIHKRDSILYIFININSTNFRLHHFSSLIILIFRKCRRCLPSCTNAAFPSYIKCIFIGNLILLSFRFCLLHFFSLCVPCLLTKKRNLRAWKNCMERYVKKLSGIFISVCKRFTEKWN